MHRPVVRRVAGDLRVVRALQKPQRRAGRVTPGGPP